MINYLSQGENISINYLMPSANYTILTHNFLQECLCHLI